MEAISLKLEDSFAEAIQKSMRQHNYTTKSEFIREAIRHHMRDLQKEEALNRIYGASKRKTSKRERNYAGKKAFLELEKELR